MSPNGKRGEPSWPASWVEKSRQFLARDVWSVELVGLPTFRAFFYKVSRVLFLGIRGVVEDRCLFRASALTYITVLSVVPLLAFAFSVAKGLGAYETLKKGTIEPFLDKAIASSTTGVAGEPTADLRVAIDKVLDFVTQTDVSSLGLFGLAILMYTVVKLLSSVEKSFNDIWGVKKSRSIVRKLADYLSMVIIVPIFLVSATAMTTAIESTGIRGFLEQRMHLGPLIELLVKFSSLAVMWVGFTFVYLFMPNTRTRVVSALIGGIVGGTLWHLAQLAHVKFQLGMANYNAIYSGFAAFPIFMIWIYVSWVTVLLGAEFAFAHQNEPAYRQIARSRHHDHAFKEVLALRAMVRVAVAFLEGRPPYPVPELAESLGVPERSLEDVLQRLCKHEIAAVSGEGSESAVLPARDLDRITMKQVTDALKGTRGPVEIPRLEALDERVDAVFAAYEKDREGSPTNRTLRDLAELCLREIPGSSEPVGDGVARVVTG